MTESEKDKLDSYYRYILETGNLRTIDHAKRWSHGVLSTLGSALKRKAKRDLADNLPEELAQALNSVFWLVHFRDPALSGQEFLNRVGKRSGNSNGEFARYPTLAVFGGLKAFAANSDLEKEIAEDLSPDISRLWQEATTAPIF